jgi:hypothetical protein
VCARARETFAQSKTRSTNQNLSLELWPNESLYSGIDKYIPWETQKCVCYVGDVLKSKQLEIQYEDGRIILKWISGNRFWFCVALSWLKMGFVYKILIEKF